MTLRDRIFELVFPDRKKAREEPGGKPPVHRKRRRRRPGKDADGYDPRYFVRHQR